MDMVRVELERMAANVERMGSVGQVGGISSMMGELHTRLDEVRDRMVTREAYDRLFDRIRQLEVGVEAAAGGTNQERAFEGDAFFHEQTGDVDNEGDVSDYGYFDGDGNYIESEEDHAEWDE